MHESQSFHADLIQLLHEKHARGQIDRRQFLKLGAALGLAGTALGSIPEAHAQAKEVVMVNWGGMASTAFGRFYGEPFEKKNPGIKVVQDTSGPSAGKIRTQAESGKPTWDICDSSAGTSIELGNRGLLEPIDYSIVDKNMLPPKGFAYTHGAAAYSFSSLIIYNAEKFKDNPPKTWADFWDLKKYPGKRMLRRDVPAMLDAAIMADGVPADKVYPIDLKRALKKIGELKKDAVYWNNGSESEQIMRTGEAVMGLIWNTRAKVLFDEGKGKFDFTWNQGILQPGIFVILKNNPAGKTAQHLLRSMQDPGPQVELLKFFGNGPANPQAAALVPPEWKKFDPMTPENARVQCVYDGEWYGKNQAQATQEFLDLISS
ncbi:MAG: extracellular solute-binding protein [Alphaproteobacteria bacterium]|nr:extracellular solute-binding protein [Alphaproteobacteria bacterium]